MEIVNQKYYNKEKLNKFEKALLLLVLKKVEDIEEIVKGDSLLENVAQDIISYSRAREIVDAYENEVIEENYRIGLIEDAKERGMREGLGQGLEQGGKQEKIQIAKNLLSLNLSLDDISKATGLLIDDLKTLQDNI